MKPIVHTPNQVLIKPSQPIAKIDKKILEIIDQMKDTLELADKPKGVGLAAPQIGLGLKIFLIKPDENSPSRAFINPKIIKTGKTTIAGIPGKEHKLEGCLSIPKVWGLVRRFKSVTISFQDETGQKHIETFSGFPAIIVQHEMDHLEGILFSRRVVEQKGQLYKTGTDAEGKEVLEPIDL